MGAKTETSTQQALGGTAIKPPGWDRTGFEAFRYMLFNPETGEILTRTPLSWIKIFVFYCVYYTCLAAFWAACLQIFFLTLPDNRTPRWTMKASLIGNNPGVGLRPTTSDRNIASSLYILNREDTERNPTDPKGEGESNADVARRMDIYMGKYSDTAGLVDCTENHPDDRGKCLFKKETLGECSQFPYGFLPEGGNIQPCFFLKLNKIYGLDPAPINDPAGMPTRVQELFDQHGGDNIYFHCEGRYPADNEGANGEDIGLKYFPENQAISRMFFPYMNGPNYQPPMVAVKITNPPIGRMLHLECRAYYGGVVHNTKDKMGLTQFEVLVQ